jgi:hypothetical protein
MVMPMLGVVRLALIAGAALTAVALIPRALAQDAAPQDPAPSIDFRDSDASLPDGAINLTARLADSRFAPADPTAASDGAPPPQVLELQIAADREHTGAPVDISFAQRGMMSADGNRQSSGSEVRVGRGLITRDDGGHPHRTSVYAFVASDNHALTWRPGARSDFGGPASSLALQDQINIGDNSAGVTYEHDGVQASLAYVERSVATHVGNRGYSQDENFAGVTVTMRH